MIKYRIIENLPLSAAPTAWVKEEKMYPILEKASDKEERYNKKLTSLPLVKSPFWIMIPPKYTTTAVTSSGSDVDTVAYPL